LNLIDEIYERILNASNVLKSVVHETPLDKSRTFSHWTGSKVYLKLENLQKTGSFKVRGAYYKIHRLLSTGQVKCVVAVSAGNHAQGVAWAASKAGIRSLIFMPEFAPAAKINATKGYGAEVVLHGRTLEDSYEKAMAMAEKSGYEFIHPFNDMDVIAGQGTIGLEILKQLPKTDAVIVPIGGGGLISGIAIAIKRRKPTVKIFGVEAEGAASMKKSIEIGRIIKLEKVDTIADGIAVKSPGELTFQIVKEYVDDIVTVDDFEISTAIFKLLERAKVVAEPAGAASIAALLSGKIKMENKNVVAVISGGNIDASLLATILEKNLITEGRVIRLLVELPDKPGTLKRALGVIAEARANIIDVSIDRTSPKIRPGRATVLIKAEVQHPSYINEIVNNLKKISYSLSIL